MIASEANFSAEKILSGAVKNSQCRHESKDADDKQRTWLT